MRSASGLGMASKPAAAQPDGTALAADDAAAAHTLDFVGLLAAPARHIRLSVGALQYGELRERQLAAMTFAFLAKRSRELCNSISELQGILPLTWSLTAYAAEPETLRSCLVALRYLARFAAYANAVAEKGGTPPLVALIDSEHAGVRLDAAACAAALCEHDEVGSLMIDAGVVPAAKRLATAEEEELQHWGMAIVAHLAAANPKNRYVLMEAELLPQMLTLCRPRVAAQPISPVQRQTQQQALRALDAICTMPEAVAALNGLTDFFPLLFELRDDSDPLVSPHPGHWHPGHWPSPSLDPHHPPSPPSTHHSPLDLHPDAAPTLTPNQVQTAVDRIATHWEEEHFGWCWRCCLACKQVAERLLLPAHNERPRLKNSSQSESPGPESPKARKPEPNAAEVYTSELQRLQARGPSNTST